MTSEALIRQSRKPSGSTKRSPAVIILTMNYNRPEDTIECIASLLQCRHQVQDIVILDNGSTDGSFDKLKDRFYDVTVLRSDDNLGFSGGMNYLLRYAQTRRPDYMLFINNDTTVDKMFLTYLVDAMEKDPRAAVSCGTIYCYHDQNRIWYGGGRLVPFRGLAVHLKKGKIIKPETLGDPHRVSFVTGCLLMLRSSTIDAIGYVDERFFMYLEDIELSSRIARLGFDLLYVPKAIIYHKVLGEGESAFKLYYSARNRLLFIDTALKGATKYIASGYFLVVVSIKLIFWFLLNPVFFRAAVYGMQDFFTHRFYKGRGTSGFARSASVEPK